MNKRFMFAPLFLLCLLTFGNAQERRPVTVNVTQGEPIKGLFVRADAQAVIVQSGVAETTIKLEDVKSIVFEGAGAAPTPAPLPTPERAKEEVVKALRRIASGVEVGINRMEYARILAEAKADYDGAIGQIQDVEFTTPASIAMEDYLFAAQVWDYVIENRNGIPTKSDLGRLLINKYSVPMKPSVFTSIRRDGALPYIWHRARGYYQQAEARANK